MVVPRGNAPRSPAYRADALLLSYGTEKSGSALQERFPMIMGQSRNATLAMLRLSFSVFISTRCQPGSVMTAWSGCRILPRA